MSRTAIVAGRFYPNDPAQLKSELAQYIPEQAGPRQKALAVVLPHAGYI